METYSNERLARMLYARSLKNLTTRPIKKLITEKTLGKAYDELLDDTKPLLKALRVLEFKLSVDSFKKLSKEEKYDLNYKIFSKIKCL